MSTPSRVTNWTWLTAGVWIIATVAIGFVLHQGAKIFGPFAMAIFVWLVMERSHPIAITCMNKYHFKVRGATGGDSMTGVLSRRHHASPSAIQTCLRVIRSRIRRARHGRTADRA